MKNSMLLIMAVLFFGIQTQNFAAPVFPAGDNSPLKPPAEKPATDENSPPQNVSTSEANNNKSTEYHLAKIEINILHGLNKDGEKSYKATYQLSENKSEPEVKVSFKKKADEGTYGVEKIEVKKSDHNAYKITAKIVPVEEGETVTPEVIYAD